jgi:predicted nucleic acid-binding protein
LIFLEVALGGQARHLVTGNIKHFPARERRGVSVLKPAQFLGLPEVAVL